MDTENSTREAEAPAEADIVATTAPAAQPEPIQGQDIDIADDSDSEDSLTFSNGVIEKIVAIAMRDVPGVVGMKGSWLNRVQDAFGASDTTKGVSVEVTPEEYKRSVEAEKDAEEAAPPADAVDAKSPAVAERGGKA